MDFKIKDLKNILIIVLATLLLSCQKADLKNNSNLKTKVFSLDNGLNVVVTEKAESPLVSGALLIKAGSSSYSVYAGTGIAHFVEHMLFRTGRNYKGEEISRKFSSLGGYINAYTTFDYTVVHFSVGSEHLDEALEILSDMVFGAEFLNREIETERQVILKEINLGLDAPDHRLTQELFLNAYRVSNYRHPIIGYEDLLMELKPKEIYEFYKRYYSPDNMVLAVVGNTAGSDIEKIVEAHFGKYKRQRLGPEAFIEEPPQISSKRLDVDFETSVTMIAFAYRSVDMFDKDMIALDVLSAILADVPGSVLNTDLVDKKRVAYAVNAYNYTPEHDGLFIIRVDCKDENRDQAIAAVRENIEKIKKKGVSGKQLKKAKNFFLTGYYKELETNENLAGKTAVDYALTGDYNFSLHYVNAAKKLTLSQIKEAASKYLIGDNMTIVVLSRLEKKEDARQEIAPVEKPQMKVLTGGLKVILKQDKTSPLVNFRITYLGGLKDETAPLWGISNLTASLLFEGTSKYGKEEIDDLLSDWGALHSTYNGNNTFGFSIETLCDYNQNALELVEEIMLKPSFASSQIEKQKQIIKASIEQQETEPFELGYLTLKESLYPEEHPFAHSKLGDIKSIDSIMRLDIVNYYRRHLDPVQIVIAVFGNFETDEIMPRMEKIALGLEKNKLAVLPIASVWPQNVVSGKKVQKELKKEQAIVMVGYQSIGVKNEDRYALEVLTKILSGSGEKLYEKIRSKKGFSYMQGAFNTYGIDEGFYAIYVSTTLNNTEAVSSSIKQQTEFLKRRKISTEELERAKNSILGEFLLGLETNGGFACECGIDELYGFGYDFYEKYPQSIKAVTADDVEKAAEKYFLDGKSAVVVISAPIEEKELKK